MTEAMPTTTVEPTAKAKRRRGEQDLLEQSVRRQEERTGRATREVAECLADRKSTRLNSSH